MTNKYLYITLLTMLGFNTETWAQESQATSAPRLVVSITIDQLRADLLEAFAPLYSTGGFHLLLHQGLVYDNASYPFAPVDRASAIAALSSGTTPYYNNIVGEKWLNRETLRPVYCTDDARYQGLLTTQGASPAMLGTSTVGDELKVATGGKAVVFAIAPFRDAAVMSAGHAADGALWIDDQTGNWCSSTYYFPSLPSWVSAFNELHAPTRTLSSLTWEPLNALVGNFSYFMQTGPQQPFKHKFTGEGRYHTYKTSAMVNEDVTLLAQQCMASMGMGNDRVTDLLSVTYYAGNYDQKAVTDCQMELQDTYVRLDRQLAQLIQSAQQRAGEQNVLFVITATGYTQESDADYQKYHVPTGTFYLNRTAQLLNMYFGAVWGQGSYVETYFRNQIFLNHKLLETKKISIADATNRAQEFLAMMSGVRNVYTSLQLLTGNNERTLKTRNAYSPDRCGDLLIEVAPGWRILNEDTQDTEWARASFVPFPIIIYGAGTRAERVNLPVSIDRIAPTIARSIRIRAPNACAAAPLF